MIRLMVYGHPDDADGKPLDFIEAAKLCNVRPDIARRWLDRSAVRAKLHADRRAFRNIICSGNEGALKRIRDKSPNSMAQLGAIRTLEQFAEHEATRAPQRQSPGFVIQIINAPAVPGGPARLPITIDPQRDHERDHDQALV